MTRERESDDRTLPLGAEAQAPAAQRDTELVEEGERYHVEEELARGGMGRVLVARGERLGRTVAIKTVLDPAPDLLARFEREAKVTARLQHPGIVPVYGAGKSADGTPFYAMKLVSGRPLDQVISEASDLRQRLALLPNVIAIADALAYAHSEKVIHRDLKPSNVLVGRYGETVVVDWGLAQDLSQKSGPPAGAEGTPAYMPPEQARGQPTDERADVYAIGAVLYQLLSGAPPYRAHDETSAGWNEVRARVIHGPPTPLDERAPALPPPLLTIVSRAMSRQPADRYATAGELAERLRQFQTGSLVSGHRYSAWELLRGWIARHRAAVGVSVAALLVLVVGAVFGINRIRRERDTAERQRRIADSGRLVAEADRLIDSDPLAAAEALVAAFDAWPTTRAEVVARRWHQRRLRRVLPGRGVAAAANDGAWIITQPRSGHVRLWDTRTWLPGQDLDVGFEVSHAAFSPDDSRIAFGSIADGTTAIWRRDDGAGTWRQEWRGLVAKNAMMSLSWNPSRPELAATFAGTDGGLFVIEPDGERRLLFIGGGHAAFGPTGFDGKSPLAFAVDRRVEVRDSERGEVLRTHQLSEFLGQASAVAWSKRGRILVGINGGDVIEVNDDRDAPNVTRMQPRPGVWSWIPSLTPRGELTAVASSTGEVSFLTDNSSTVIRPISTGDWIGGIAWSSAAFAVVNSSGGVALYDLAGVGSTPFTEEVTCELASIIPDPTGHRVVTGCTVGILWTVRSLDGAGPNVQCGNLSWFERSIVWSPDGLMLAGLDVHAVHVWKPVSDSCELVASIVPPSVDWEGPTADSILSVAWGGDPADRELIIANHSAVSAWRLAEPDEPLWVRRLDLTGAGTTALNPDGARTLIANIVSEDGGPRILLADVGEPPVTRWLDLPPDARQGTLDTVGLAWRPGTDQVALAAQRIVLLDAGAVSFRWISSIDTRRAKRLAWSGDGRLLAAMEPQGRITVLDGATGLLVAELDARLEETRMIGWAPHGDALYVAGGTGPAGGVVAVDFPTRATLVRELREHVAWGKRTGRGLEIDPGYWPRRSVTAPAEK